MRAAQRHAAQAAAARAAAAHLHAARCAYGVPASPAARQERAPGHRGSPRLPVLDTRRGGTGEAERRRRPRTRVSAPGIPRPRRHRAARPHPVARDPPRTRFRVYAEIFRPSSRTPVTL